MTSTNTPVRKAVIAAAGFGTRFFTADQGNAQEMLPLVDKPIIQVVVEELVSAGIKDIIIVTGSNKRSLEDHFDLPGMDLTRNLEAGGPKKAHLLEEIEAIGNMANFIYLRQKGPYGNATPVSTAAHVIGNEPFIYTYADDFFDSEKGRTAQMVDVYNRYGGSVFACKKITEDKEYDKYGVAAGMHLEDGLLKVDRIVEKPGKANTPSDLASVSGYLLTPAIFEYIDREIERLEPGKEIMIQDAMQAMIQDGIPMFAKEIDGRYHDTGDKLEYMKTVVEFAMRRNDIGPEFVEFLKQKLA